MPSSLPLSAKLRELAPIVAVWAVTLFLWLTPGLTAPDSIGYFQYLPSVIVDGDLAFHDEWAEAGLTDASGRFLHEMLTPTGMLGNHWSVGSAVGWLPGFLAGHAIAPGARTFAPTRVLPAVVGSAFAALLALVACWSVARVVVPDWARLATLAIYLGSPLLFYALRNGVTSHAMGALCGALVVWTALRLRDRLDPLRAFGFGLAVGIACAVRPQNAPFALVALLVLDTSKWRQAAPLALPAFAGALIGGLPELVVSVAVYGTPWGFLPVGDGGDAAVVAPFTHVRIVEPLLSWYHGMLPWTPLLGVAISGFWFLWKRDAGLGRAAVFCFASQWFVAAFAERTFWGGYAFGQRRFDNCTIFFVLGLAAILPRLPRWLALATTVALSAWSTLLLLACPRFDLNAYQPPAVLIDAMIATLADPGSWLVPLAGVPGGFKASVIAWILAHAVAVAGVAVALSRIPPRRREVIATALAAFWLLAASGLLLRAASASPEAVETHAAIVARNREPDALAGPVQFRMGLLRQEIAWLEAVGRVDDAARTRAELEALQQKWGFPP